MKLKSPFKRTKNKASDPQRRVSLAESYKGVKVSSYYAATQRTGSRPDAGARGVNKASKQPLLGGLIAKLGLYAVIIVILAVSVLYSLALSTVPIISQGPYMTSVSSEKSSNSYFTADRYTASVTELLQSNILNRTKLTLRANDIERSLKKQYPEIATVVVHIDVLGAKPRLNIRTYEPVFTLSKQSSSYIVLEDGSLIKGSTVVNLAKIEDVSGIPVSDGEKYLRQDDIQFLDYVQAEVKSKKQWGIEYFKLTNRPREVSVKVINQSYEVKMYFDEDMQQQVGSWIASAKKLGEGGEAPSEYLDVRVSEKVFWK